VQRTIRTVLLRRTRHSTCTLRPDSYEYLIKAIGFTPPSPTPHIRACSSTPNALPVSATWASIAHSTPVHYTRPEPAHYVCPTPTYSTQPAHTRSTNSTPTTNHHTNSMTVGYTHPAPAFSTQPAPTRSTNSTPTTNHHTNSMTVGYTHPAPALSTQPAPTRSTNYTPSIPAGYTRPAPTHSTQFNNRSSHVHWQTERTSLLPTVYNRTQRYSEEPSGCSSITHVILFIVVVAVATWAVWKWQVGY
jgi:hypothetical protein